MGYVEPKPGIPPSPSHTFELIDEMKRRASSSSSSSRTSTRRRRSHREQVGGEVLVLAPSVGGVKEADDYIKLFDYNVSRWPRR